MSQGAAAAAPATSQGASQGSAASSRDGGGQGGAAGAKDGAGAFDYQSAFKSQTKKMAETEQHFSKLQEEWNGKKGDLELVSKLKGVFQPEQAGGKQPESPVPQWEQQLDFYIEQAVEAKNRGQGIPLTANLAISHFKSLIENYNATQEYKQQIKALQDKVESLADPGHNLNQRAFYSFDTHIKNGLERIYGRDPSTQPQRQAQFRAIGQQVSQALQELMQKNPQRWDQMRRDPKEIEQLANRALRMNLPPKAVQMIEQENLRNTPMGLGELRQAFKEADSIKNEGERARIKTQIRQDILALSMSGQAMAG